MDLQVHHIGIVVDDIDRAKEVYERVFGLKLEGRYPVAEFQAECAFIPAGNTYIELVKPMGEDGLKKFLDKHGSGTLHHICYIVDDIEEGWKFLKQKGLRSVTGEPRATCTFEKAMFFHPKDTGNVLIEFVTRAACPLPPRKSRDS
ncbi:MAG TPA: VOC family protein [Thermodesulfobacteriota bacterium]|nr:VOC family protein [Thermodesulfobacteriota bacterium]